jgi:hypoxanthine phosphoribosyltransferase
MLSAAAAAPRPQLLFSEQEIARRVGEIGGEVARAFEGRQICVVGLMKSCLVFMGDLIRLVPLDMTCHFLESSSLREHAGARPLRTDIVYSTDIPYEGRDVLLLEGVVDTGITLSFLLDHIREHGPQSLKVCAIIDKPGDRKVDVRPDWAVFTLREPLPGDRFIVGYGLDCDEQYRGLPFLGTIPRPVGPAEGRKITISRPGGTEQ